MYYLCRKYSEICNHSRKKKGRAILPWSKELFDKTVRIILQWKKMHEDPPNNYNNIYLIYYTIIIAAIGSNFFQTALHHTELHFH